MDGKPRFFCDNCSAEVGYGSDSCPRCGRVFASVRCPSCGLVGEDALFSGGCPSCGYSAGRTKSAAPIPEGETRRPLPFWAVFLAVGMLAFVLSILLLALT